MAFTKIAAAGIGSTELVTLHSLEVLNNATVGGVLTYEDVTNVDSIGIVTARAGVLVGSGITLSKDGDIFATGVTTSTTFVGALTGNVTGTLQTAAQANITSLGTLTGLTINGDATFTGSSANVIFDQSDDALEFNDDAKATFGTGADTTLTHSGADFAITNTTGNLNILNNSADAVQIRHGSETMIKAISDGAVELYHDNSKKFETTDTGVKIDGGLLEIAHTSCHVDFMETSTTNHRLRNGSGNFHIQRISDDKNTTTTQFLVDGGTGSVELYHEGTKKLSTQSGGICFNSDTNDANALDDYEEGAWTMTAYQGADSVSQSAANQRYTKIGNMVTVVGEVNGLTNTTSAVFTLAGLPYAVATVREGAGAAFSNNVTFPSGYNGITVYTFAGSDRLRFYVSATGASWHGVQGNQIGAGDIIFTASYLTS